MHEGTEERTKHERNTNETRTKHEKYFSIFINKRNERTRATNAQRTNTRAKKEQTNE